jgi:hypothetical protein
VDFPEPDGPTRAVMLLAEATNVTFRNAQRSACWPPPTGTASNDAIRVTPAEA